jgi:hypothetical protein
MLLRPAVAARRKTTCCDQCVSPPSTNQFKSTTSASIPQMITRMIVASFARSSGLIDHRSSGSVLMRPGALGEPSRDPRKGLTWVIRIAAERRHLPKVSAQGSQFERRKRSGAPLRSSALTRRQTVFAGSRAISRSASHSSRSVEPCIALAMTRATASSSAGNTSDPVIRPEASSQKIR